MAQHHEVPATPPPGDHQRERHRDAWDLSLSSDSVRSEALRTHLRAGLEGLLSKKASLVLIESINLMLNFKKGYWFVKTSALLSVRQIHF